MFKWMGGVFEWVGGIFRRSAKILKLKLLRHATPTWDAVPVRQTHMPVCFLAFNEFIDICQNK